MTVRRSLFSWAAIVAVLLWGPSVASSMTGGIPQNPEPGWSAKVFVDHARYICSGELIAPRWVLTAGHCTFGNSSAYNYVHIRGVNIPAIDTVTDPRFEPAPRTEVAPYDVGLMELPVDAVARYQASVLPIATPAEQSSFLNHGVTIFGYGHYNRSNLTSPVLRKSPNGAWTLSPHCRVPGHLCFLRAQWATANNILPGDSGGAWVGWRDNGWRLLAVNSGHPYTYINKKLIFLSTPVAGVSPNAAGVGDWIESVIGASADSPAPPAHGSVALSTLCETDEVQLHAVNGCPYRGTSQVGPDAFERAILIEDNDESVIPTFWKLIAFPATTCTSISLTFGMPANGSAPEDVASIRVSAPPLPPQSATVGYGQIGTLTAALDGHAWTLENAASSTDDKIAINGLAACATASGY